MKRILIPALSAIVFASLAGGAEAYTHHPSTPAERAQTKALNEQQLELAKQENTALSGSAATDASENLAVNAPPAAAPTAPVQQADTPNPPGSDPTSGR